MVKTELQDFDLPDLNNLEIKPNPLSEIYTVRVPHLTKRRIQKLNKIKTGLNEQLRDVIEQIVDLHWLKTFGPGE